MLLVFFNPKEVVMGLRSAFGTDSTKEKQGTSIDIIQNDDGTTCRMKLLRMGASNKQFMRRYANVQKRFRGRTNEIGNELELEALRETFVDTVLLDWENVEDIRLKPAPVEGFPVENSKYMPFNRQNAILLFKELPDLFNYVVQEASNLENFQAEADQLAAKN